MWQKSRVGLDLERPKRKKKMNSGKTDGMD